MLNFTGSLKIFLAVDHVDLRKSFSGLWSVTQNILKENPTNGALYVFTNRRHTRIKILYWDGTGLWVLIKRLEKGTFSWPKGIEIEDGKLELAPEALAILLDGIDLRHGSLRPWYQR
jgi:transposase